MLSNRPLYIRIGVAVIAIAVLIVPFIADWRHARRIEDAISLLKSIGVSSSASKKRSAYVVGGAKIDEFGVLHPIDAAPAVMLLSNELEGVLVQDERYIGKKVDGQIRFIKHRLRE